LEEGEAGLEGITALGVPRLEEGGHIQTTGGALRAAGAAADLAGDDERAQAAFGQVGGGLNLRDAHELEERAAMAQEALGQGLAGMAFPRGVAAPEGAGAILHLAIGALPLRRGEVQGQALLPALIQGAQRPRPRADLLIGRVGLFEGVRRQSFCAGVTLDAA